MGPRGPRGINRSGRKYSSASPIASVRLWKEHTSSVQQTRSERDASSGLANRSRHAAGASPRSQARPPPGGRRAARQRAACGAAAPPPASPLMFHRLRPSAQTEAPPSQTAPKTLEGAARGRHGNLSAAPSRKVSRCRKRAAGEGNSRII